MQNSCSPTRIGRRDAVAWRRHRGPARARSPRSSAADDARGELHIEERRGKPGEPVSLQIQIELPQIVVAPGGHDDRLQRLQPVQEQPQGFGEAGSGIDVLLGDAGQLATEAGEAGSRVGRTNVSNSGQLDSARSISNRTAPISIVSFFRLNTPFFQQVASTSTTTMRRSPATTALHHIIHGRYRFWLSHVTTLYPANIGRHQRAVSVHTGAQPQSTCEDGRRAQRPPRRASAACRAAARPARRIAAARARAAAAVVGDNRRRAHAAPPRCAGARLALTLQHQAPCPARRATGVGVSRARRWMSWSECT